MRPWPMHVRLFVGAHRELRDVAVHAALGHAEANVPTPRAALFGRHQRQVDGVGDKVGVEQQALLFTAVGKVVALAAEAVFEVDIGVENKARVAKGVDDDRPIRHRNKTRGVFARAIEMLMHGVEWDGEDGPRLPLKTEPLASAVPHRGAAPAIQHVDHFFKELALRRELLAGRDFTHVAVVRCA